MKCPSCGMENPDGFRFCGSCGSPLEESTAASAREERKVVTVLFCDFVGFTARWEAADPEDVRATLEPYHRLVRRELERYGGTVEKFIGDAVMAVFGAPVAHEDDAERAIRAALRILEELDDQRSSGLDVDVRIGINTGETVVALGARPEHGEAMVAGDVVNTASRIQGVAPINGIAVPEATHRLTADMFEFEPLDPVQVKGKAEPLLLQRVVAARSRFGADMTEEASTPFVGREDETMVLESTLRRAIRESSVQSITIVGEPGVGKSRLVRELFTFIDELDELISWRQGRCPPYGEGITFWALADIVKAQAGVLESDDPIVTAGKLRTAVAAVMSDEGEREWVVARLEPLVGLRREGTVEQEESFTAWTRFLEAIASTGPLIVVIEDLHWADEPLLAYLEHLVEYVRDVPILVVSTARPELFERAPHWGGGRRNVQTLALPALAQAETSLLVSALLEQSVLPEEVHALVLERSGGNPLYAEQFIRMLRDRGLIEQRGRTLTPSSEEVPFPENVQALIAARLDTLDGDRKALLQDASVIGKVFWSAAVASMGSRPEEDVDRELHELARRELVRASRVSSVKGTQEYSFWHALLRDVAYGQVPRAQRAAKHLAAARWIERMAADRVADQAEVLAFHYGEALGLTRLAGLEDDARDLVEPTTRFLTLAGERTLPLDPLRAERHLRRAIETSDGDAAAAHARLLLAEALHILGRNLEAISVLEDVVRVAEGTGDTQLLGRTLTLLSIASWYSVGSEKSMQELERAIAILETDPPSAALVSSYASMTASLAVGGSGREAIRWADRTIALAKDLNAESYAVEALGYRGLARLNLGDAEALSDLERALMLALERNLGIEAGTMYNNLAIARWLIEGPARSLETLEDLIRFAEHRGLSGPVRDAHDTMLAPLFDGGQWDRLTEVVGELAGDVGEDMMLRVSIDAYPALVASYTGAAPPDLHEAIEAAHELRQPEVEVLALMAAATLAVTHGDREGTLTPLEQLMGMATEEARYYRSTWLAPIARACAASGEIAFLHELVDVETGGPTRSSMMAVSARAAFCEASEDWSQAVATYAEAHAAAIAYGSVVENAHALLGLGRCMVRTDSDDATMHLVAAREAFASLGAERLAREADEWLAGFADADAAPA